jgi:trigger factor
MEELNKIVLAKMNEYLKEKEMNLLFEPLFLPEKTLMDGDNPDNCSFSFEVGLYPAFTIDYDSAKNIPYYQVIASDEEIDLRIKSMRRYHGIYFFDETVEHPESVLILSDPSQEDEEQKTPYFLMLEGVKEEERQNFIDKKRNEEIEIDTTKTFISEEDRNYFFHKTKQDPTTAPEKMRMTIELIYHIIPAEMNADFYAKINPSGYVNNETLLREAIHEQITLDYQPENRDVYYNQIFSLFCDNVSLSLPDDFIKRYFVVKDEGCTNETIDEQYVILRQLVVYKLIRNKIVADFNLFVTKEELTNNLREYIYQTCELEKEMSEKQVTEMLEQRFEEFARDKEKLMEVHDAITTDKIISALKEHFNPKIIELSVAEYLNKFKTQNNNTPALPDEDKQETDTQYAIVS